MSAITKVLTSRVGKLTGYMIDEMELFFDSHRKVRSNQTAIAKMCSTEKVVTQGQIRQFIEKLTVSQYLKIDVVSAKNVIQQGGNDYLLYDSEVIEACLENYNPTRFKQFRRFGIDEGLAQMAGVPLPKAITEPVAMSQEDQLIIMAEASIKFAKISKAAKNNPGDVRQMQMILDTDKPTLDGYGSIFDMAEANGIDLDPIQARAVGMIMAGIVKGRKELTNLPKVQRKTKDIKGHWQCYQVNSYPLSMTSSFLSACAASAVL